MILKSLLVPLSNLKAEYDGEIDVADMGVGFSVTTVVCMILAISFTLLFGMCSALVGFNNATVQHTNSSIIQNH